jgi:hypothetical protein
MHVTFVLMPSPLLGGAAWQPVSDTLARSDWEAVVVEMPRDVATPEQMLGACVAAAPADGDSVLVPHSNAGLFAPALAREVSARGIVFVDAATPGDARTVELAPPALYESLAGRADADGMLPPWTQWWEPADLVDLFPSEEWRRRIEQSQRDCCIKPSPLASTARSAATGGHSRLTCVGNAASERLETGKR